LHSALIDIVDQLNQVGQQFYLKSEEAEAKVSLIRKEVESGIDSLGNFESDQLAKLIFASILLSGQTLYKLKDLIKG
jgi:hypothetical protein